jgi:hypothetical protein
VKPATGDKHSELTLGKILNKCSIAKEDISVGKNRAAGSNTRVVYHAT